MHNLGLFGGLPGCKSSILPTDGVRQDSTCSMTSERHSAITGPKLIWKYFHATVECKQTSLDLTGGILDVI